MTIKLRVANRAGGDWLHEGTEYADIYDAEIAASMAFADHYVDSEDTIQAFDIALDDGRIPEPVEEWCRSDFNIEEYEGDEE